ncbi:MAG: hypothetical protein Q8N18_13415 [Opitutaceae bacterium]|nr:hypothetical protein [Opitutaceae bacterium]
MSETAAPPVSSWRETLVLAIAAAALTVAAAMVLFSTFMFYDDEGYVLHSLKDFAEHGGLYREVYTQYGPLPFVLHSALHAVGVPLTHLTGRLLTLGAWAGTAIACLLLAGTITRSVIVRVAVLAAAFVYLWVMASEPSHPGGFIVLVTALLALLGYRAIAGGAVARWALLAGAGTAALLLTKINVGVFAAFSVVAWWLLHHERDGLRKWAPLLVSAAGVVLPFGLMRPLLGTAWVQDYALVFATSAVAVTLAIAAGATGRSGWRDVGLGIAAAGALALITLGVVVARGTSPADLLEGMLLGPLRQPVNFNLRFLWPPGIAIISVGSLALGVAAWALRARAAAAIDTAVAIFRLVAAAALAVTLALYPSVNPGYHALGFALPCLWAFAWRLEGESRPHTQARAWATLLLLGQSLHAFPVPGSQIAWGTVLVVPLAAMGAWEAAVWLGRRLPPAWRGSRALMVGGRLAIALVAGKTAWEFARVAGRYPGGQSMGLPGAEAIRLPDGTAALFRALAHNAVAHADRLFSLPGTFSFNLWTGVPPPTRANVTHWFSLLNAERQQAIIRELEAHPRACVIVYPGHVKFLADRGLAPKGPLYDYVQANYEAAFGFDDVEFHVRRGRKIAPFLVAELLTLASDAAPAGAESSLLRFALLTPPAQPIARLEILSHGPDPIVLDAKNARLEITPASVRGEATAPARPAAWPAQPGGPAILSVFFRREQLPPIAPGATLVLRDAAGREVCLARLAP